MSLFDVFRGKPETQSATARIEGIKPYSFTVYPLDDDEFISREIFESGQWEPFETRLIQRLLPHFSMFVDLGANIGWYTAMAQRLMKPGSEIHAFEPDHRNFRLLKANASAAPEVTTKLSRVAVSDRPGIARLYRSAANMGDHRLNRSEPHRPSARVSVTTLDNYFGRRALPPALVKMDTQGSEPAILRGATHILSPEARENVLILEFWPTVIESAGENLDDFIERLAGFTDTPFRINQHTCLLEPATWDHLAQRAKRDLRTMKLFFDLLLVHPEAKAMATIADLISSRPEGADDLPLHL